MRIVRGYGLKNSGQYKPVQHKADENDVARLQGSIIGGKDAQAIAGDLHTLQLAFQQSVQAYIGHQYSYHYYICHAPFARLKGEIFDYLVLV